MDVPNFKLNEDEYGKIVVILSRLMAKMDAMSVCLINQNGQDIAHQGTLDGTDIQALSSLAASNMAATYGMASLIGEQAFRRIYHRGESSSIIINPVGDLALILAIVPTEKGRTLNLKSLNQAALILNDILQRCSKE